MGNAVTNPGRFIEKKVFGVTRREDSMFVHHPSAPIGAWQPDPAQQQQVENLRRQLEQQKQEREEMLRQLRLEEQSRVRQNEQFQRELARIQQESQQDRARHAAEMANMEKDALKGQLLQVNQHIHDLENDLMRSQNKYDNMRRDMDDKAVQVHEERMKIAHFEYERNDPSVKNIVVIGMTGDGKSTLCNRLCLDKSQYGEEGPFVVSDGIESETIVVCKQIVEIEGQKLSIVDTPGIADSQSRDREHINNVMTYLRGSNGVNQFLVVKSIANPRFDSNYQEMLRHFEHFLGEEFWAFTTIVLTHCDGHNMRKFRQVKEEFIRQLNKEHPFTQNLELAIVAVGIDDYEESLIGLVTNIVPTERYLCEYLTSPLDELAKELDVLKSDVEECYQEVERVKGRLASLQLQRSDVNRRLA